jgi:hypothetical protein
VSRIPRVKPLEDPIEIAYGSDILSLIAGYDVDADRRQRNREIACSGKYKPTEGEIQTLLKYPRLATSRRRRFRDGS